MLIGEVGRDIIEENNDMLLLTPLKADLEYIANYTLLSSQFKKRKFRC